MPPRVFIPFLLLFSFMVSGVGASEPSTQTPSQAPEEMRAEIPKVDGKCYGTARWYASDNSLVAERECSDGKFHGLSRWYYPSGALKEEGHFERGVLHGPVTFYSETGDRVLKQQFVKGKLPFRYWLEFFWFFASPLHRFVGVVFCLMIVSAFLFLGWGLFLFLRRRGRSLDISRIPPPLRKIKFQWTPRGFLVVAGLNLFLASKLVGPLRTFDDFSLGKDSGILERQLLCLGIILLIVGTSFAIGFSIVYRKKAAILRTGIPCPGRIRWKGWLTAPELEIDYKGSLLKHRINYASGQFKQGPCLVFVDPQDTDRHEIYDHFRSPWSIDLETS